MLHPDVVAKLGGQAAPATRETVRKEFTAFKNACAENTANRAFVFLTGHGIQLSSRGAILLLEDFATAEDGDLLFGAMDVMGCHGSMWATGQADHQVWFSDACRQKPEVVKRYESVTGAWKPGDENGGDVAATPILLSSGAREQAFADPQGLTLFTDALLWGLRGGGVVGSDTVSPQWHVSTERLSKVLQERVRSTASGRRRHPVDRPDRQVRRRGGPRARRTTPGRHRGLAESGRPRPAADRRAQVRGHRAGRRRARLAAEAPRRRRPVLADRRGGRPGAPLRVQAAVRRPAALQGRGAGPMTDMGQLNVRVDDKSLWLSNNLPFVVRDATLSIVGEGRTGQPPMSLPAGLYSVEAVTPRGRTMQQLVAVDPATPAEVVVTEDSGRGDERDADTGDAACAAASRSRSPVRRRACSSPRMRAAGRSHPTRC